MGGDQEVADEGDRVGDGGQHGQRDQFLCVGSLGTHFDSLLVLYKNNT